MSRGGVHDSIWRLTAPSPHAGCQPAGEPRCAAGQPTRTLLVHITAGPLPVAPVPGGGAALAHHGGPRAHRLPDEGVGSGPSEGQEQVLVRTGGAGMARRWRLGGGVCACGVACCAIMPGGGGVSNAPPPSPCRYFLRKLRRVKKANGQIVSVNEVRGMVVGRQGRRRRQAGCTWHCSGGTLDGKQDEAGTAASWRGSIFSSSLVLGPSPARWLAGGACCLKSCPWLPPACRSLSASPPPSRTMVCGCATRAAQATTTCESPWRRGVCVCGGGRMRAGQQPAPVAARPCRCQRARCWAHSTHAPPPPRATCTGTRSTATPRSTVPWLSCTRRWRRATAFARRSCR